MPKSLNGLELASYIKERQAHQVRSLRTKPTLAIIRDNDSPVIAKYVELKQSYGADIGIEVADYLISTDSLSATITKANNDPTVTGIILQLPLLDPTQTDVLTSLISPNKDVDGLSPTSKFDSATALAIHHLLSGYGIDLKAQTIAIIGRGRLVGAPLEHMWRASGYNITVFDSKTPPTDLHDFNLIVTAVGKPNLITPEMIKPDAILVDAGTASEDGHLVGDIADSVRDLKDITITPKTGGVGPMTITMLFENLLVTSS